MSIETMRELQAYGYFILIVSLSIGLYAYYYHLYKSEKTGRRNYEKYGKLALDDSLEDEVLESVPSQDNDNTKKEFRK
ncbi:cytochrome c oxidase, cbb3-type, CcoQ subunit [Campylobacter geochelonis]|uniref:Cytochrome c oxidase, Cbb3-type, CcoQ subunit n=1 Tax=Campylobacter geochelonis TaxID=1780362 RepID=A0A128EH83_9BACT|nr:cytochrome c oxidase, cbb3-type, CcoQ subunit [Campylobacter geochelonis]QKF71980.1 cytochrome c oxidase CcoNOPQ, cbb3-type, subunit IV [Campylobacter geochelonis]CZE47752.1 cytochrome c oxidase%2C Cbb3-type%2C CcoQ subunit [Campylobacter geochelonis]CZE48977.1 cytochrome c oxidase%2C Cbb3-type%2C CcoQ subunit [Campylobacter geochelonis]CZE49936.1 cytochrome c oxidase%2C Cbb3-type%2C CcoQ subunit [Campylobacter geochelonis]